MSDQRTRSRKSTASRSTAKNTRSKGDGAHANTGSEDQASNGNSGEDPSASVGDIKLRELLILRHQGFTQEECAERFGVSARSIRNWLRSDEMAQLLSIIGRRIDPARQIGRFLCRVAAREAGLLRLMRQAEAEGNHGAIRGYEQQLRHLANDQIKVFRDLGLFKTLTFEGAGDDDRSAKEADILMGLIDDLATSFRESDEHNEAEKAGSVDRSGDDEHPDD